jgi:MFS family permease
VIRLAVALFAVQAGFHGFTASLPVALARAGLPDPQIGLIVGTAAAVQIPAALAAGVVIDRVGGLRVFVGGGFAYLAGSAILLLPGVEPGGPSLPFVLARLCQGVGLAGVLPSALSLVPRLAPPARLGFALAFIGSAHNVALVAMPPLSLAVLAAGSLHGVAAVVTGFVVTGLVLVGMAPLRLRPADQPKSAAGGAGDNDVATAAHRRFGFAFRRAWALPIAIIMLSVAYWGVVVAYLPQRAEAAGADIGLFFVADGIAILSARVPTGWLTDRIRPVLLVAAGLLATAIAVALLALPPTTPLLIAAGALCGAGAGLVMTPMLVELSRRSGDADRGSALALFSAGWAVALTLGSVGGAPIVGAFGFEAALLATLGGIAAAAVFTALDPGLRVRPTAGRRQASEPPAPAAI